MRHKVNSRRARLTALIGCASLVGGVVAAAAGPGTAAASQRAHSAPRAQTVASTTGCHLGHGIKHVIELTFDNVHFFRDNPNVPSDLEMIPNLLHFFEHDGTFLSNNHTPLIAHTGDDILTTLTGLYGDRQGDPIANDYQAYNKDGTTDPATAFTYWTDPIYDTASHPNAGHDTNPNMVYSPTPPATTVPKPKPDTVTPAPWVPYTRAGCDVGGVATANMELENPSFDIPKVFGPNSPEAKQLAADPDSFKDPETADYVGVAVHCAKGGGQRAFCADATGVKYGQTKPTHTATADRLPSEPGGYTGYQALFGHRYVAPQLGAGTPNLSRHGYEVTNSAGNLVDLNGNQLNGAFLTNHPGFPGFGEINASQSLAYVADMAESGVPVVYDYIADIHGNENIPALSSQCANAPDALGSGSACYIAQAQYYNQAFGTFFKRLAADGITTKNTLFVLSSDEGDHEAGANVGRAVQPTPANCDGATVSGNTVTPDVLCTYPSGTFGELSGNMTGMVAQAGNTTPFSLENDTAPEFYVTGRPGPDAPDVRGLEHTVAGLTAANTYTGTTQPITNYIADPAEEGILHMVNADPARTPTFALFAKPDYYLQTGSATCGTSCVTQDTGFAWDHGDYAAEIDTNYAAFAGPGVKHLGLDGSGPSRGPNSAGPNSGQETVPSENLKGPWTDETDIRPTIMYLTGLTDDYEHDGRVITQILSHPNAALRPAGVTALGECYKQMNSSVGDFGTDTLQAATKAVESHSAKDRVYKATNQALTGLDFVRDRLAEQIKGELEAAAFHGTPIPAHQLKAQTFGCQLVIAAASKLDQQVK
jgi:hypothetical protein